MSQDDVLTFAKLILVLPLAAFLVQVLLPWKNMNRQGDWIPTGAMGAAMLMAWAIFYSQVAAKPNGIREPIQSQIVLGAATSEASVVAGVERTFRALDKNHDGLLDERELGARLLPTVDTTRDGAIDRAELTAWRLEPKQTGAWLQIGESLPVDRSGQTNGFAGGHAATLRFDFGFLIDNLTAIMLVVVTTVSFLVHVYSTGYMRDHHGHPAPRYGRFFAFLGLFTFSMLGLILTDNLFMLFVFWELVGVCSYFLIGFEFERPAAQVAQIKAFLTTRVGDLGFFLAIMIIGATVGSFRFDDIYASIPQNQWVPWVLSLTAVLLFIGPVGKSAQFPLHVWLPDAMEGPTPVSALIHAATMVAAGVYLVARMFPFFAGPSFFTGVGDYFDSVPLAVVAFTGAFTALFAATIALCQNDIKKVLAYSTISQLGYMVLGIGVGSFSAGMFHLWTHAFFKALLFLGSGSVIHAVGTNDMREMGGLRKKMPITYITFFIATMAIAGVPFLSGFYSKEAILTQALSFGFLKGGLYILPFAMGMLTAGLTAFYMFRIVFMTFFGEPRNQDRYDHAHESPPAMWVPLAVLCGFTVLSAGFFGFKSDWFHNRVGNVTPARLLAATYPQIPQPVLEAAKAQEAAGHGAPSHGAPAHGGKPEKDAHEGAAAASHGHHDPDYVVFPSALDTESRERAHQLPLLLSLIAATVGIGFCAASFVGPLKDEDYSPKGTWLGAYRKVLEKLYYMDDLYRWAFINPSLRVRLSLAWFDRAVIDRVVDSFGEGTVWTAGLSEKLDRRSLGMGKGAGLAALAAVTTGIALFVSRSSAPETFNFTVGALGEFHPARGAVFGTLAGLAVTVLVVYVAVRAALGRAVASAMGFVLLLASIFGAQAGLRIARWSTGLASTNLGLHRISLHPAFAAVLAIVAVAAVILWWAGLGVDGSVRWISEKVVLSLGAATRKLQTGRLQEYLFATVVGIVAIIFFVAIA